MPSRAEVRARVQPFAGALAYTMCFGIAGLIWSMPRLRRRRARRAARCVKCVSHHRVRGVVVGVVAVLLAVGAGARAYEGSTSHVVCHSHISPDGRVTPEPYLEISPPPAWEVTRTLLVAPISGVGVLAGRAIGMESCEGPPLLVMFWPPPRTSSGGSTLGDVFITWMPGGDSPSFDGYGITQEPSVRYGPNISPTRANEEELGLHESRHVDQWAVGTFTAGPFAFPVAYFLDGALFPGSRNHFERDAGLEQGGYPPPPGKGPAPRWPETAGIVVLVAVTLRRRLRWLARVAIGGRHQARAHAPKRCPVHSPGWSRVNEPAD
jgi:hypothetical protein